MASVLRSGKFVRAFASFARKFVLSSSRGTFDEIGFHNTLSVNVFSKTFATQAVPSYSSDSSLDKSLRRLDQDVRRTGRISKKELEDVLEELRHTGSASSTQSLLIIRCCGNLVPEEIPQVRTQLVQEIWKTLEKIGVPMDISHYNALLRVYLENEYDFSPTEFLADLEHKGIEPNRVTYQRLIASYCQQGDIEGATRILEFMREKQLPVNENVFNALITGHSQADDMESAAGILGVMRQAGLEPSADTYTTLLCGYARKGNIEAIMSTIEECESKDIYLMDRDYMDVIYALAKSNNAGHVDKLIEKLRQPAGYNQDAVNLILCLINHGYEDIGFKIFQTMPRPVRASGEISYVGAFFIRQLVKANRPIESITSYCDRLAKDYLNPHALLVATETSLQLGNISQAIELLKAMKDREYPIRQHYFWPLLAKCNATNDTKTMMDILSWMAREMKIVIGGETLRDYIIPHFQGISNDQILVLLRNAGISVGAAATAMVSHLLSKGNIAEAAQIATKYHSYYSAAQLRRPLVQAYIRTEDADSFVTILRQIHDAADHPVSAEEETQALVPNRVEIVGQFVNEVASLIRNNNSDKIQAILQKLVDQGLGLSNSSAELLQEKLGGELISGISNLLSKLTSGELVPAALKRPFIAPASLDEAELKKLQKTLEEKGESTRGVRRQLFYLYCRNKDIEKAEQIIQDLQADDFVLTGGMYAQLMDLYVHHEKLEEAMSIMNKLFEKEPDFNIDNIKIIRIITLMVKNDKVAEAIKFLSEHPRENKTEERPFGYNSACWRLLNSLAEQGKSDELNMLFNILVKNGYIEVNNVLLGPLIKVHLVRDDLQEAMKAFEWCCQTYRSTPFKNELARKMIQAEDAVTLQKLTDLSTQVHGEVNSLYDLVLSFVECGRIRQARKILETPGLRSRPQRLNFACARYHQEGMVASLEGLVEATRDISHIDRADIYYHLLLSYCKAKEADKALGLWTRMQEEDVQPSDDFLATLGKFLKNEGREVPFKIPEIIPSPQEQAEDIREVKPSSGQLMAFRKALQNENTDECLTLKRKIEDSKEAILGVNDLSSLIEILVKKEQLKDAKEIAIEMLKTGLYPMPRIFNFLTIQLSAIGDIETLQIIGKYLSEKQKKKILFDNRLCNAYSEAGKGAEYLQKLQQEIDSATEANLEHLAKKFPRGGFITLLNKNPEFFSQYEELALKYAEKGILGPMNVLWIHLFAEGKDKDAKIIWDKYLSQSPRIIFRHLLKRAQEKQDEEIPKKILRLFEQSPISDGAKGTIHSCIIDVFVAQQKLDEALLAVKEAIKDVCLENLDRITLKRLQEALKLQGKDFPFVIPAKDVSSSSSSSDDEIMTERKL